MNAFLQGLAVGIIICLEPVVVFAALVAWRSRRHAALTRRLQPNGLAITKGV